MPEDDGPVLVEVVGQKSVVTLNRPEALNAQDQALRVGLAEAVERFEADDDLLVMILTGAGGRAFSAGADLKEIAAGRDGPRVRPGPVSTKPDWVHFEALRHCEKPVIAAIDGYAVGGGLEVALYCDIRICTEQSRLGMPEPRTVQGLGGPGVHLLSRSIPFGEAMLIHLTSQPISGRRAYEIGLVQRVCADREELMATAHAIADDILTCSGEAVRAIKRILQTAREMTVEQSEAVHLAISQTRFRADGGSW